MTTRIVEGGAVWFRVPRYRVEPRARWWWMARAALGTLTLLGVAGVLYLWFGGLRPWLGPPLVIGLVVSVLYVAIMPFWRYVVHRWEPTDEAVYARTGWYVREWRVAPISRIQTVDTSQGPIEQMMGLSTLAVTTASAHGAIYISGLDQATAAEAAQRLTQITQLTPGDQT
ncbi:PH domain-containing protein [Nocardiopsis synnemataformans]|uniref:PH domain-containing protein n=1 Tax=Nocardiopsis synnemataformans TaxID=61305 RepID=UPI003EB733B3